MHDVPVAKHSGSLFRFHRMLLPKIRLNVSDDPPVGAGRAERPEILESQPD